MTVLLPLPRRRYKYGNKPVLGLDQDGRQTLRYASQKEAKRAAELELLVKAGEIRRLQRQTRFDLIPKQEGERSVAYIADFAYEERRATGPHGETYCWIRVVEDVKSPATRKKESYIIKRKLMLQVHGIRIRET